MPTIDRDDKSPLAGRALLDGYPRAGAFLTLAPVDDHSA